MTTLWLVTSGVECQEVEAVCSSAEMARAATKLFPDSKKPFSIKLDAVASVLASGQMLWMCWHIDGKWSIRQAHPLRGLSSCASGENLRLMVWAKTKTAATKQAKRLHALWLKGEVQYPDYKRAKAKR